MGSIAGAMQARNASMKPSEADWLAGPHAAALSAIEALALATPGTAEAAQVSPARLPRFTPV